MHRVVVFKAVKIYKKLWDNQGRGSSFHQIELSKNIDISGYQNKVDKIWKGFYKKDRKTEISKWVICRNTHQDSYGFVE